MILRFFSLAACVFITFSAIATESLSIAVSRTPLSLPLYVAEHEGYFTDEGVQVRFEEVIGGHRALQAMLDGKTDMATISETGFMFKSFKHQDMAILASFVNSNDDIKLVARADSGIRTVSDLAGKRVGIIPTTSSHYFLDTLLILSGVDDKSVHTLSLQPEAMADALRKGEVDAVSTWEPYPFQILANVPGAHIVPTPHFYTLTFNLVTSRKITGKGHDEALIKILRALDHAQRFIAEEPAKAQIILKTRLGLQQPFVDWIWPRYNFRLALDQSLLSTLENEARWAQTNGHIQPASAPNYLNFIYSASLRKAHPNAVSIAE